MGALPLNSLSINEFEALFVDYSIDVYTKYTASTNAPPTVLRALLSVTFSLFGHRMYLKLNSNMSRSIFAGLSTEFCVSPFIFVRYGRRIRLTSKVARNSADVEERGIVVGEIRTRIRIRSF